MHTALVSAGSPDIPAVPQTPPKKIPKVVSQLHEALGFGPGNSGKAITADMIKGSMGKDQYNNFCNTFRNTLTKEQKAEYKQVSTKEKEDWLCQWAVDPNVCQLKGYNRNTSFKEDIAEDIEAWITVDQLGGAQFLNNPQHADMVARSGELDERPHRFKCLADAGVKEYRMSQSVLKKLLGSKEEAGVEAECDLKTTEYEEVRASMAKGLGSKPKKVVKKEKVADPDLKALRDMNSKKGAALRALKRQLDSVNVFMQKTMTDIPKLVDKGYPEPMTAFYTSKLQNVVDSLQVSKQLYAQEVMEPEENNISSKEKVAETIKRVELQLQALEKVKKEFESQYGSDLKKLVHG